jgi:dephospho-CoA kinase
LYPTRWFAELCISALTLVRSINTVPASVKQVSSFRKRLRARPQVQKKGEKAVQLTSPNQTLPSQQPFSPMIIFLTGTCGAGKTSLANHLKATLPADEYEFHQSDATPLPSNAEVERLYVDGWSGWQKVNTRKWVDFLVPRYADKTIIWDGQTNMDFLDLPLKDYKLTDYKIVLIECSPEEMFRRLIEERKQPELAHDQQLNWRKYLHRQAKERGGLILDSTGLKVEELAARFMREAVGL